MWTTGACRAVVAGVDGSQCALHAVRWAAVEATRRSGPLRLLAAYAWSKGDRDGDHMLGEQYRAILRAAARQRLAAAAQEVALVAPGLEVEPAVVVGSRGRSSLAGLLLGSVGRAVLGHAHCPVAVVGGAGTDG